MGYYYDWVDSRWLPIDHQRRVTLKQQRRIDRRRDLLQRLLLEIARGNNSVTRLYAQLLARALLQTDEMIMREDGQRVVGLLEPAQKTVNG
jgi:hypothetical protein